MRKNQFVVLEAYTVGGLQKQLNEGGSEGYRIAGFATNGSQNRDGEKFWAILERKLPDDSSDIPTEE